MKVEKFKVLLYLKKSEPDKNGKSRKAVETNEKIERLLLAVHSAFNSLMERKKDFDAAAVRDMFQGTDTMGK
jgi:protein-arginine kinase activator protein McsA